MCNSISYSKCTTFLNLQKLDLQSNLISNIDYEINLLNLAYINLSDNQILKVYKINTSNLIELNLSRNSIRKIKNLKKLMKLEKLDLHHNKIDRYYWKLKIFGKSKILRFI